MPALKSECGVCSTPDNLLRCGGCKVVFYCGREHQADDRPRHKRPCSEISKNRQKLERSETKLRAKPSDAFSTQPIFEDGVGHFWGILETRDYMRGKMRFRQLSRPRQNARSLFSRIGTRDGHASAVPQR
ncbi:uncharacterized protein IWZ02DRAFT_154705 [Phyllosticta citriasiana]|uniref:MYND-type domain-containing protein n=1 Tax=Phyllosticta citriasiana TaxID=595635 RepID=A0ABR1KY83_9PEZI